MLPIRRRCARVGLPPGRCLAMAVEGKVRARATRGTLRMLPASWQGTRKRGAVSTAMGSDGSGRTGHTPGSAPPAANRALGVDAHPTPTLRNHSGHKGTAFGLRSRSPLPPNRHLPRAVRRGTANPRARRFFCSSKAFGGKALLGEAAEAACSSSPLSAGFSGVCMRSSTMRARAGVSTFKRMRIPCGSSECLSADPKYPSMRPL